MKKLIRIHQGLDTTNLQLAIARQPELFNRHRERKDAGRVHSDMDDIWLRYNDIDKCPDLSKFNDEHESVFYPEWYLLPQLRPIVFGLMARMEASRLGGVLITRIPPSGHIKPHVDDGWHANYYNTKLYVVIKGNEACVNRVEDETAIMQTGEVWFFNNLLEHEVINHHATEERITLIVCMRCEQ